jgi:hypothetical protein
MRCNNSFMRPLRSLRISLPRRICAAGLALVLAACGGGGGADSGGSNAAAGGNTSGGSSGSSGSAGLTNFQDLVVDAGPANGVNALFTTVTVCATTDATNCKTVDHVLVDTGSTGLRLLSSVLPASLKLASQNAANGNPLVECTQFADGYSWGPVRLASLKLGGETIASLPIQVIGDPAFGSVPTACSSTGPAENTVADFGANGVLGVGNFAEDCGAACAQSAIAGFYYACGASGCSATTVPTAQQVRHPVTLLAKNNNGVLLRLPAPPSEGAVSLAGTMIFGIGTDTNNGLGGARVLAVDASSGTLSVSINGTAYANSFLDSGSNALFFPSPGTPVCDSHFYCPTSPLTLSSVVQGKNGISAAQNLSVTNADTFFNGHPSFSVAPSLGGTAFDGTAVDLGLPFFFGRTVFTAIEGRSTPGGVGPYVAF